MFLRVAYPAVAFDRYLALIPPESTEEHGGLIGMKADSVVPDPEQSEFLVERKRYLDPDRIVGILERVVDQVVEEETNGARVSGDPDVVLEIRYECAPACLNEADGSLAGAEQELGQVEWSLREGHAFDLESAGFEDVVDTES